MTRIGTPGIMRSRSARIVRVSEYTVAELEHDCSISAPPILSQTCVTPAGGDICARTDDANARAVLPGMPPLTTVVLPGHPAVAVTIELAPPSAHESPIAHTVLSDLTDE